MGMFDSVYLENEQIKNHIQKLIKDDEVHPEFQTKDFENMLGLYKITDTGLEREKYLYRNAKRSEQTVFGKCRLPLAVKVHKGWEKLTFTHTLNVYTSTEKGKWVELFVEYFRGKLMAYTLYIRTKRSNKKYEVVIQ